MCDAIDPTGKFFFGIEAVKIYIGFDKSFLDDIGCTVLIMDKRNDVPEETGFIAVDDFGVLFLVAGADVFDEGFIGKGLGVIHGIHCSMVRSALVFFYTVFKGGFFREDFFVTTHISNLQVSFYSWSFPSRPSSFLVL